MAGILQRRCPQRQYHDLNSLYRFFRAHSSAAAVCHTIEHETDTAPHRDSISIWAAKISFALTIWPAAPRYLVGETGVFLHQREKASQIAKVIMHQSGLSLMRVFIYNHTFSVCNDTHSSGLAHDGAPVIWNPSHLSKRKVSPDRRASCRCGLMVFARAILRFGANTSVKQIKEVIKAYGVEQSNL